MTGRTSLKDPHMQKPRSKGTEQCSSYTTCALIGQKLRQQGCANAVPGHQGRFYSCFGSGIPQIIFKAAVSTQEEELPWWLYLEEQSTPFSCHKSDTNSLRQKHTFFSTPLHKTAAVSAEVAAGQEGVFKHTPLLQNLSHCEPFADKEKAEMMPISTMVSPQTELSGLGSIQTLLKVFPTVTATLAENPFFRQEVPTASSGSHPLSLNTTHTHDSLPSHLLRCSMWCWQQHRHDSRQGRHGAALRSLHLTPSQAGRTQEHQVTQVAKLLATTQVHSISQQVSFS